jgi:DNA-binding CsgD family transcriptional regulator
MMTHTSSGTGAAEEEQIRAILDGLRAVANPDDRAPVPSASDAHAILDDAWSMLSEVLAEYSTTDAGELLDTLRCLSRIDQQMLRRQTAHRIGNVLNKLDMAQCSVPELLDIAPSLICELGFDRAIISRIEEGVWIPERAFVADDPEWTEAITRVGREHPKPLVPQLIETRLVRRRQPVMVYDVQQSPRVHRAIAEEARSSSYAAAPIMSGNRVIGLLHGDCYLHGRDVDADDLALLVSFAHGLQLALSRAAVVEQLQSLGDTLRGAAAGLDAVLLGVGDVALGQPRLGDARVVVDAPEFVRTQLSASSQAARSVRDLLTDREFEVLELVALGRTNAAIASRLFISEGTVKQHVKHILRKLRVENRAEAVSRLFISPTTAR